MHGGEGSGIELSLLGGRSMELTDPSQGHRQMALLLEPAITWPWAVGEGCQGSQWSIREEADPKNSKATPASTETDAVTCSRDGLVIAPGLVRSCFSLLVQPKCSYLKGDYKHRSKMNML